MMTLQAARQIEAEYKSLCPEPSEIGDDDEDDQNDDAQLAAAAQKRKSTSKTV